MTVFYSVPQDGGLFSTKGPGWAGSTRGFVFRGDYIYRCSSQLGVIKQDKLFAQTVGSYFQEGADWHGLCIQGDNLYVVDSSTDCVVKFSLGLELEDIYALRHMPLKRGYRELHYNDICPVEGGFLLSCLGGYPVRRNTGFIEYVNLEFNHVRYVAMGLQAPHSVKVFQGDIYYCESMESRVVVRYSHFADEVGSIMDPYADTEVLLKRDENFPQGLWIGQENGVSVLYAGWSVFRGRGEQGYISRTENGNTTWIPVDAPDVYEVQVVESE